MSERLNAHEFRRQLEQAGEERVRNALSRGGYAGQHEVFARKWLSDAKVRREETASAEQLDIARSNKDAAWVAAEAARDAAREAKSANTIATLALIVAVIAIAVAVVGIFVGGCLASAPCEASH